MTVNSIEEIEAILKQDLKQALDDAATKALLIMHDATLDFYSGGQPSTYVRTGALEQTPDVKIKDEGFSAFLNGQGRYTTGKRPTMNQVLHLTNDGSAAGLRPAVGKTGYWNEAEQKIIDAAMDAIGHYFG